MKLIQFAILTAALLYTANIHCQEKEEHTGYKFEIIKELPHTQARDQGHAGTCWSYAATSFLESEIIRMGKDSTDLSELFFVYHAYRNKAQRYIMRHGKTNFSQGGQAHDVMNVISKHGMVPEKVYRGKQYEGKEHNHSEVAGMLAAMLKSVARQEQKMPLWLDAFTAVLNVYLGVVPEKFEWNGKEITPKKYREMMKIKPENYVEITSYDYYPYYKKVNLDIPDNWSFDNYYNVKMNDLTNIINNAIEEGYTVCWDGDVSEPGFNHDEGFAVLPVEKALEEESYLYDIAPEKEVTKALRENTFMTHQSTDDHLMHLVGQSKDRKGNIYYIIKNSWNTDSNNFKGKLHMSLPYLKAKTIAIMVHKDAIPGNIKKRLEL